jgi:diacylglycerol kinase (ATP)
MRVLLYGILSFSMHHDKTGISFSLKNRISSFTHAFRGLMFFIKREHNAWIHLAVSLVVVILGFVYHISATEWMFLVIAIGLVFITEAFNTALEVDMNLTSPGFHPFARDVKDIAAGGVLVASLVAFIVGCIIFLPKLF